MKLNSKLFDRIRIKPRHAAEPKSDIPTCSWDGCDQPGTYRAPIGHRSTAQYRSFCLEHVRAYNQSFDYFAGMKGDEVEDHILRAAATGERPTWRVGTNGNGRGAHSTGRRDNGPRQGPEFSGRRFSDPLNIFARTARFQGKQNAKARERRVLEPDRRAFETLGLDGYHPADEIKKAYKALVKKHHPDANGGDRASEDRLRAIIAAYSHLKAKGYI